MTQPNRTEQPKLGWTFTLRTENGTVVSERLHEIDFDEARKAMAKLREGLTGRFKGCTITAIDFWGNDLDAPE